MKRNVFQFLCSALSVFLCASSACAATFTVSDTTDASLRAAIASANAGSGGDTISITATGTITLTGGDLLITQSVTIQGPGASQLTIDANHASRVFICTDSLKTLTISGITFTHGAPAVGSGGAISAAGTLHASDCKFMNNKVTAPNAVGGAVSCHAHPAGFTNCRFEGNIATDGNGGALDGYGALTFANCQFVSNQAGYLTASLSPLGGGALCISGASTSTLTDCLFQTNQYTGGRGGALAVSSGGCTINVSRTKFLENQVIKGDGGAILQTNGSTLTLTECAVENNSVTGGGGGGIYMTGVVNLQQALVANNTCVGAPGQSTNDTLTGGGGGAGGFGGGIFVDTGGQLSGFDSTISDNTATGGNGGTINQTGTGAGGGAGGGIAGNPGATGAYGCGGGGGYVTGASGGAGGLGGGGGGGATGSGTGGAAGLGGGAGGTGSASAPGGGGGGGGLGGGIFSRGVATCERTTFTANRCVGGTGGGGAPDGRGLGGGVYGEGPDVLFRFCIIAGNFASSDAEGQDTYGEIFSWDHNVFGKTDGSTLADSGTDSFGTAASPVDARLGPLADNGGFTKTHALLSGSPALDKNTSSTPGIFDQRGQQRGYTDAGAFEAHPSIRVHKANMNALEDAAPLVVYPYPLGDSYLRAADPVTSVTATSSNQALIPNANIAITGSLVKTLTLTLAPEQFGTATITFTVATATSSMSDSFDVVVSPMADTPGVTNATAFPGTQTTSGLVFSRNPVDGTEVQFFKIVNIVNGTLRCPDGTTTINDGDFISASMGMAGLKFTPAAGVATGSFEAYASLDAAGTGLSASAVTATITVSGTAPQITSADHASGVVGAAFSHVLSATGTGPITFAATGLPGGLTLSGDTISGSPTTAGVSTVSIAATGPVSPAATQTLTLTVTEAPAITCSLSASGTVGAPFSLDLAASGTTPISWSCSTLPAGLTLNGSTISGTPTEPGNTAVTITASNGTSPDASSTLQISINATPVSITSPLQTEGKAGTAFGYTLTAAGTAPFTFTAGDLPDGLYFCGTTIAGAPKKEGTFAVALSATDALKNTATATLQLTIYSKRHNLPPGLTDITAFPNPAFTNEEIMFFLTVKDEDDPSVAVVWDFGDGATASGTNVTHTFASAGTHTVTATASDGKHEVAKSLLVNVSDENPNAPRIDGVSVSPSLSVVNADVIFTASVSDPNGDAVAVRWDLGDGSAQQTGPSVTHQYRLAGSYIAHVWAQDATGLNARSWDVSVFVRDHDGEKNVEQGEAGTSNPLNGMKVRVADSNDGAVTLEIDLDTLVREAFDVVTQFSRAARPVRGLRPTVRFETSGIYIATTTARNAGTTTVRGRARKTLPISRRETGEPALAEAEPVSPGIEVSRIAGKFRFAAPASNGAALTKKTAVPDSVLISGTIELPTGMDCTKPQEIHLAVGNVVESMVLDSRGKGSNGRCSIRVLLPKGKSSSGQRVKFSAKIAAPDLVSAGFDTEGVTAATANANLSIQCALVFGGSAYLTEMPVQYKAARPTQSNAAATGQFIGRAAR